ncbi:hypothetical protein I2I05_19030 [Hymenobacter sp. BT683]|uniref:Transposase n=1 Tax=Hymenobacter jeongseonensis TaxID=2791027 RepID=A0ABS0INZ0_9BACT|nr:hypothetical protein [Hymenobacter jeongseonensis]MBF9239495.1 hypothetical protein [Hymenobacter jeongseonensis]
MTINQKNNSGNSINGNQGTATQNNHHYNIADCEKDRDTYKAERDLARTENELLRQQLAMQEALIAAKDETLTLLRGSHNRPN